MLTLRGEKKSEVEDKDRGYTERSYGRFERRIGSPARCRARQGERDLQEWRAHGHPAEVGGGERECPPYPDQWAGGVTGRSGTSVPGRGLTGGVAGLAGK